MAYLKRVVDKIFTKRNALTAGRWLWFLTRLAFMLALGVLALFLYGLGWLLESAASGSASSEEDDDRGWEGRDHTPTSLFDKD